MGETWDQVQKETARVPYKVVKGDNNTPRVDIDGRLYTCLLYTSRFQFFTISGTRTC